MAEERVKTGIPVIDKVEEDLKEIAARYGITLKDPVRQY
jgi:hypothetical protein